MFTASHKVSLNKEDWLAIEQTAEDMTVALVGSLRLVLGEVRDVVSSQSLAPNATKSGTGGAHGHHEAEDREPAQPDGGGDDAEVGLNGKRAGQRGFMFTYTNVGYDSFVEKMKDRSAMGLRSQLQSFCREFMDGDKRGREEAREMLQGFMEEMEDRMAGHPLWSNLGAEELEEAYEGLEKYLVTRLHTRIFASDLETRTKDASLRMRIAKLQFIHPDHLDVPKACRNEHTWQQAIVALQRMSQVVTPKEKLDAVLEASEQIYAAPILNGQTNRPVSADEYLPILVYVLLRANPSELQSNIDYISSFRSRSRMVGEAAYFFTHLAGAVFFIETLDASSLSIEPALFDKLMTDDDENIYTFVSVESSPAVPTISPPLSLESLGHVRGTCITHHSDIFDSPASGDAMNRQGSEHVQPLKLFHGASEAASEGREGEVEGKPLGGASHGRASRAASPRKSQGSGGPGHATFQQFSERSGLFAASDRSTPPGGRPSPSKEGNRTRQAAESNGGELLGPLGGSEWNDDAGGVNKVQDAAGVAKAPNEGGVGGSVVSRSENDGGRESQDTQGGGKEGENGGHPQVEWLMGGYLSSPPERERERSRAHWGTSTPSSTKRPQSMPTPPSSSSMASSVMPSEGPGRSVEEDEYVPPGGSGMYTTKTKGGRVGEGVIGRNGKAAVATGGGSRKQEAAEQGNGSNRSGDDARGTNDMAWQSWGEGLGVRPRASGSPAPSPPPSSSSMPRSHHEQSMFGEARPEESVARRSSSKVTKTLAQLGLVDEVLGGSDGKEGKGAHEEDGGLFGGGGLDWLAESNRKGSRRSEGSGSGWLF